MFSISTPNIHWVSDDSNPATFNEGVNYVRYLMKWALKELDYQAQRHAMPLSFNYPAEYVRFMNEHIGANLLAVHNFLPTLSDIPSGNHEEDRYLRDKIIQKFEQAFEKFLANTRRLAVTTPPIFNPNTLCPAYLFQQVATDLYADWRRLFEQILALTDNAQTAAQHANDQAVVEVKIKADLPDSYQQLTNWLISQAHWIRKLADNDKSNSSEAPEPIQSFGSKVGVFFFVILLGIVAIAIAILQLTLAITVLILLILVIGWLWKKHPFALLGILLGISLGS